MASKLKIFSSIIVLLLVSPTLGTELTYKKYAKASEIWKRGFVFGISRYMSAVAQPDEEPPTRLGRLFRDASATQRTVFLCGRSRHMSQHIPAALTGR
jgi:hypothetical protein